MHTVTVESLHIYPIKSCGGIDLSEASIGATGFAYDRQWMIVKPDGQKITQRDVPAMALIETRLTDNFLVLNYKSKASFRVPINDSALPEMQVDIWGHKCGALDEGEDAARWLSEVLEQPARLVRFNPSHQRSVERFWAADTGAHIAFSDMLPYLITAEASLAALNERRAAQGLPPSAMNRFRPNVVISGPEAYGEEAISALQVGDSQLEFVRLCSRCPITNTDQETGAREKGGNLAILGKERRLKNANGEAGAMFGVQAIATGSMESVIRVGDQLEIAELSTGLPPIPRFGTV